jgi:hypothetical protein
MMRKHLSRIGFTTIAGLVVCVLALRAALAAGGKRAPMMAENALPKPPIPEIVSLELQPSSLSLADARDSWQVLVWGLTAEGKRIDLSSEARFTPITPEVEVVEGRYLHGVKAGDGVLRVTAADRQAELAVKVASIDVPPVRFGKDVMPILASVGCNAGTCHGAAKGRNGFKLSLRGYDMDLDYHALADDLLGRRINKVEPARSLMLLKPAGIVAHEGGKALSVGSRQYQVLEQWIKQGAAEEPDPGTARPNRIEVLPAQVELDLPGRTQRLIVIAHYADGSKRDVTRDAVITSSKDEVAKVSGPVLTGIRRGEAAVLVRYEGNYAAVGVSIMGDRTGFAWVPMPEYNFIDHHVNAKLQQRQILPSDECTDAEFLRRVYLDLTGLIPTAAQAREFLEDQSPSRERREKLVDRLIGSKEYVAYWSNKWADLLQCNKKALGDQAVWAFREWIRESVSQNKPYDKFAYELLTAQGSSLTHPAVNYYRALKDRDDTGKLTTNKMAEDVSQTFLGVRFSCNKCHDHPFERWTQTQYYEFGAFFARVAFKPGTRMGEEIVYADYRGGEVTHPKTTAVLAPHVPYGQQPDVAAARFRQESLARWLTSKENPLFAKSFVNRTWSYFFGPGIIDPVDDVRASNPPSNAALLDALTEDFVASGFDVQHLIRLIVASRAYQGSVKTNRWNDDDRMNFSHFLPRRLSAEQLMDCIAVATGTRPRVPGLPEGMRSVYLADGLPDGDDFLKLFGRPKRETACECERTSNLSLAHALSLVNGPVISGAVSEAGNGIAKLVEREKDDRRLIEEIYLATLARMPTETEVKDVSFSSGGDAAHRLEEAQDLAWALLNSPAFLFNR